MSQPLLHPNSALRSFDPITAATVLLVGAPGVGKSTAGRALLAQQSDLKLQIREVEELPLPADPKRPRIDFIIFVLDLTNLQSLHSTLASVQHTHPEYYLGRCIIVASKADKLQRAAFPLSEIEPFTAVYEIPIHYADLTVRSIRSHLVLALTQHQNSEQMNELSKKILRQVELANGHRKGVSPLLLRTADSGPAAPMRLAVE